MQTRQLGTSGPVVSQLALGGMTFGNETDEPTARDMLDAFVEAGGTLVDTSDNYHDGTSERWIGRWLRERPGVRDRIVLATKGRYPVAGQPGARLTPAYLRTALDASLARLGVDRIDLYQLHGPDDDHSVDEIVEFLAESVAAGKVGYVGISNFAGWQVAKLARLLPEAGGPPLVSHQVQYNLLAREIEWEVVPAGIDAGVGAIVWGPLGQGWLTGKYRRDSPPAGGTRVGNAEEWYLEAWHRRDNDRVWAIVDTLLKVAADLGVTPGQAAVAWVADRPGVTAPIIGARNLEQLTESLGAAGLHLPEAAREKLTELSAPPLPDYPYGLIKEISSWHS